MPAAGGVDVGAGDQDGRHRLVEQLGHCGERGLVGRGPADDAPGDGRVGAGRVGLDAQSSIGIETNVGPLGGSEA